MKVGIVTHYYHSMNYGGNLQSYALPNAIIKNFGIQAEQICYQTKLSDKKNKNSITIMRAIRHPRAILRSGFRHLKKTELINHFYAKKFKRRNDSIRSFNELIIPHSREVFNEETINSCETEYDILITGSDQVWSGMSEVYTLSFSSTARKLSYSASISRDVISDKHKAFLERKLKDFYAISVRNNIDKEIIKTITAKPVTVTMDPVFLLTSEEWSEVANERLCLNEKYIFCYFLGDSKDVKRTARLFAEKHNYELVYIPNFKDNENGFVRNDLILGKHGLYDVSPSEFLGLIKNAEYVFTDSFHCLAMAIIFRKEFFAFDRISKWGQMNSRIICLLDEFHCSARYLGIMNYKLLLKAIESKDSLDYQKMLDGFEERRIMSLQFLRAGLKG